MKRVKQFGCAIIVTIAIIMSSYEMVWASTIPISYDSLSIMWELDVTTLENLLPSNNYFIQNFSRYGTNIVFLTTYKNKNTYLVRCSLSSGILTPLDYVELVDYGHGESVEITDYNSTTNTYTVWIGTTARSNYQYWSTEIARIKYTVNSAEDSGASKSDVKIIEGILNAALDSSDKDDQRVAVCVAENDNRICFSTKNVDDDKWYFMIYSFSDVNAALNDNTTGTVTLSSLSAYRKSRFSLDTDLELPCGSFQSEEINGVGSGNKRLFMAGGKTNQNCGINQFLYTNGNAVSLENEYVINTSVLPIDPDNTNGLFQAEMEGLKVYTDSGQKYMYIMFRKKGTHSATFCKYAVVTN